MTRVLIAGVTGWTGAPLAEAVRAADDLELAGGIARSGADHASVEEALAAGGADVLVDYTKPGVVRGHVDAALAAGLHVVVGTSGLTGADYAEIDAAARAAGRGVIAAGNFSVLAATLLHAVEALRRDPVILASLSGDEAIGKYYASGQTQKWYEEFLVGFGLDPKASPPVMKEMLGKS